MRPAPELTKVFSYPVVAGTALLAIGVTAASWAKVDISILYDSATIRHGELWRLVTSIFPHVGIVHLGFNLYWFWVLGSVVEEVYGHLKMAALILLFSVIPNALEFALLDGGVGLSGVGYGLFGLLWVLSKRDERFRDAVDTKTIQLFVGWFFLCVVLTVTNIMHVGNIAHGAGAAVGILTAYAITLPEHRNYIAGAIGAVVVLALWAATLGRPLVNRSHHPGSAEDAAGYEALKANRNEEAAEWLRDAITANPNDKYGWYNLGVACDRMGKEAEAFAAYSKAMELGEPDAENGVAWIQATSSDPALRNPGSALEHARHAVAADTAGSNALFLDTLAAAYYANERYQEAVETQQRALAALSKDYAPKYKGQFQKSLESYEEALQESRKRKKAK